MRLQYILNHPAIIWLLPLLVLLPPLLLALLLDGGIVGESQLNYAYAANPTCVANMPIRYILPP